MRVVGVFIYGVRKLSKKINVCILINNHVFLATWVDRFSIDSSEENGKNSYVLTPIQISKFSHFYTCLLDHDQDNLICEQDFEALIEVSNVMFSLKLPNEWVEKVLTIHFFVPCCFGLILKEVETFC